MAALKLKRRWRSRWLVGVAWSACLGACAGPPPTSGPTTLNSGDQVLLSGSVELKPGTWIAIPFDVPVTGRVTITAEWTSANRSVGVVLAGGNATCLAPPFYDSIDLAICKFIGGASRPLTNAASMAFMDLAPGEYSLYLSQFGTAPESLSYLVRLKPSSTASTSLFAPG